LAAHEINEGFSQINEINASRSGWVALRVNIGIAQVEASKRRPGGWADRPGVERSTNGEIGEETWVNDGWKKGLADLTDRQKTDDYGKS
jgi:hypothetical protein